jgi:hypothetical protein
MPRKAVPIEDRFWSKVDKNGPIPEHIPEIGPCWIWTAGKMRPPALPYGKFWDGTFSENGSPRTVGSHVWAYKTYVEDPGDLLVLHRCDNPSCVRYTTHLFAGSSTDNNRDTAAKLRHVHGGDHHSSKLTEEIVLAIRASDDNRAVLAARYGVNWSTVNKIVKRRIWKHV